MKGTTNAGVMTTDTSTALAGKQDTLTATTGTSGDLKISRYGKLVIITLYNYYVSTAGQQHNLGNYFPTALHHANGAVADWNGYASGQLWIDAGTKQLMYHSTISNSSNFGQIIYLTSD